METRLYDIIARIQPLDARAQAQARARQDTLTKPLGGLGRLEGKALVGFVRLSRMVAHMLHTYHGVGGWFGAQSPQSIEEMLA